MLVALLDNKRIEAWNANKGPEYFCPECRKRVNLKKGKIRISHFAHIPPTNCAWAKGETLAHLTAKKDFADEFRRRGVRCEIEFTLETLPGDRRADVMAWAPSGKRYAIEVQHSALELEEIAKRTASYHSADVGVTWIVLASKALLEKAVPHAGKHVIEQYCAQPWVKWIHGFNIKKLWLYDPEKKVLWQGKLEPHHLYVEERTWYESGGSENSAGGYYRKSKRWRDLHLSGPFSLDQIAIRSKVRKTATFGKYRFPGGRAAEIEIRKPENQP